MSLGILNNISAIYAENSLNTTQASLQTVLQQLSSGSRINSGADDAAGLAVVNGLSANEAALTQSAQNATNGIGLLQTADGALAQVTSLLTRAVTLATEAANSTLSTAQVSSANAEYQTILSEIGDVGSTTNFSGTSVFTSNQTNLFVSDGSATGANSYNDTVGILTTASVGQSASQTTPSSSAVTAGVTAPSAANVASTATITFSTGAAATATGTLSVYLANDTPITLTVTALNAAGITSAINSNSAFAAEGIVATNSAAGVVTLTGPANGQGGSITFGTNGLTPSGGTVTPAQATAAVDGRGTDTITLGAATDTVAGTLSLLTGTETAHVLTINSGTTGSSLANKINADATYQADGISASFNSTTGALTIYGASGTGHNFTDASSLVQTTTQTAGAGVDFTAQSISTLTSSTAQAVLTSLTTAIGDVAYQRGILGANINQLTAASGVATAENVNLTSASNAIQATNYGQATSDLAKYEVLSQTGISALAQANTVQQEILKLLQ